MTLEKSSIGPRLEAATPLTRWKHAFSPCRNGRDFTRARARRFPLKRLDHRRDIEGNSMIAAGGNLVASPDRPR